MNGFVAFLSTDESARAQVGHVASCLWCMPAAPCWKMLQFLQIGLILFLENGKTETACVSA